jgi:hypothetical protein
MYAVMSIHVCSDEHTCMQYACRHAHTHEASMRCTDTRDTCGKYETHETHAASIRWLVPTCVMLLVPTCVIPQQQVSGHLRHSQQLSVS